MNNYTINIIYAVFYIWKRKKTVKKKKKEFIVQGTRENGLILSFFFFPYPFPQAQESTVNLKG